MRLLISPVDINGNEKINKQKNTRIVEDVFVQDIKRKNKQQFIYITEM
jgi:hypothetical protein